MTGVNAGRWTSRGSWLAMAVICGVAPAQAEPPHALSEDDEKQLETVHELIAAFGSDVWPGFGDARLPLILYDDCCELLVGAEDPPEPWVPVQDELFAGEPYHWRPADRPESFAVAVGKSWAGSLESRASMNRQLAEQAREELPSAIAGVVRPKLGAAEHALYLCHETFHAFQAVVAEERFRRAMATYPREKEYPFEDRAFARAWNREGRLLVEALDAEDDEERAELAELFLDQRRERRAEAGLGRGLVQFECALEWLEGLAKHVELELCAAAGRDQPDYRPVLSRAHGDFRVRLVQMGRLGGQQRFYLSGAAQAALLDRMAPGWKASALAGESPLEDLLADAVSR